MRDLLVLAIHLLVTLARLCRPGGVRAVAAESLLPKHQLQISNRSRHRAPNLTSLDRFVLGIITLFINPGRIAKLAAILRPTTLLRFHKALVDRKYHLLFSASSTPVSHPFVERLIGTIRREYLDRVFFWNAVDLARKLGDFKAYYNAHRVPRALDGDTPALRAGAPSPNTANFASYVWTRHCRGLFETPIAA